ncbi:MAG: hypothetical protein HZA22_01060 [Nitrospirae bacterium]|nr:hypothetical protein [Nitrospirota bacterium]MBI5696289.1 hypothetical protein [Nitrospirota bacterium]
MKTIMQKIEDIFVAVTFAEAGELEEAKRLIRASEAADLAVEGEAEETLEAA